MRHDNDNDELSFIHIAAATANVARYLVTEDHPPHDEEGTANRKGEREPKKNPDDERKYIEHRLREIAAFERRAAGKKF